MNELPPVAVAATSSIDEGLHRDLQAITRLLPYLKGLVGLVFVIGGWGVRMQYDVWGLQKDLAIETKARKDADDAISADRAKKLDDWDKWRADVSGDLRELKVLLRQMDSERSGRAAIVTPRP